MSVAAHWLHFTIDNPTLRDDSNKLVHLQKEVNPLNYIARAISISKYFSTTPA